MKKTENGLSRRTLLGIAAGIAAAEAIPTGRGLRAATKDEIASAEAEGKWVSAICNYNCGGLCVNKAYVVNNTVIRQKTDDTHPDSPDFPQQRGCARGRSQRKTLMGVDRLKYPMKRKNWAPGGGKKELRGKDEWVRISWDEALNIISSEYKRIIKNYGNKSILRGATAYALSRYSLAMGGMVRSWGTVSFGAWPITTQRMTGMSALAIYLNGSLSASAVPGHLSSGGSGAENTINDRFDLRNAKLVVLWGGNPVWSSAGNPTYHILQAKKAGAKIITVDPMYSATATSLADEWIPVRPATDTALLLGMAYHMITNNLHDQAFLDKYTIGFDAAHMPEKADKKENFKDYVLGTYDKTPKTPEWASKICGTPVALIKSFAEEISTAKSMAFLSTYAPSRIYNGETFCQAFYTVGWMTGNVGKSGSCVGPSAHFASFNHGFRLVNYGSDGQPPIPNPLWTAAGYCIPPQNPYADGWFGPVVDQMWDAVIDGKFINGPQGEVSIDIRMIDNMTYGNSLNQVPNIARAVEAHRKVEFVCSADLFPTPTVQYADVVVPVTHAWEKYGCTSNGVPNREIIVWGSQVIKPMFEARDDEWIAVELGKRSGIDEKVILPVDLKQQTFNKIAGATVIKDDGKTFEPLVTITKEDLKDYGVDGKEQKGRIGIKELQKQGYYQVKRSADDNFGYIAFEDYVKDPAKHPLKTDSGKFEIHSASLAEWIKGYGFTTISPIAKYNPPVNGYEETLKGKYTLQLFTPHYPRRAHSVLNNNTWLREAFMQEIFMNPEDAAKRGIKNDDTVKVYNSFGSLLRKVKVTARIVPGAVAIGDGGWYDPDPATGIDRGGAPNIIQGTYPCGQGVQPWNSNVVEIEKYSENIEHDYNIPPKVIG